MNQLSAPTQDTTSACPRCKQPLIDPNGLGWCKACGYCKSLAESETKAAPAAPQVVRQPNTVTATGSAIAQTPLWCWITLGGLVILIAATWAGGRYLTLTPLARATFASIQIGAGVASMIIGQFIALIRIAPEDPTLTFKDGVFPFRLYSLVMKRLPSNQLTIYMGAWGFAAAISAGILIGGLGHWFTYLPGAKNNPTPKVKIGK